MRLHRRYTCDDCIWSDKCKSDEACEDIVLFDGNDVEADIDTYIEEQRRQFRRQWYSYTSDWE